MVDVNGVGYDLQISLNTYSAIAKKESGLLFTYLHITENAHTLFGFAELAEKEMFLQLISVSGVGASTARMMLSGMRPDEIAKAIVQGNTKLLESIKGIGKKSAERLIVELRDKLGKQSADTFLSGGADGGWGMQGDGGYGPRMTVEDFLVTGLVRHDNTQSPTGVSAQMLK